MTVPSNFRIAGCWSKAGVGTSIVIEYNTNSTRDNNNNRGGGGGGHGKRGARIALDLGATTCINEAIYAPVVLLTHGHIDHVGAVFSHARAHNMCCGG